MARTRGVGDKKKKMSECEFTRAICREIEEQWGGYCYPLVGGMRGKNKWPDRLIVHRDFFGLVEFKSATGKLMPGQRLLIGKLNRSRPRAAYVVQQNKCTVYMQAKPDGSGFANVYEEPKFEASVYYVNAVGDVKIGEFDTAKELLEILKSHSQQY